MNENAYALGCNTHKGNNSIYPDAVFVNKEQAIQYAEENDISINEGIISIDLNTDKGFDCDTFNKFPQVILLGFRHGMGMIPIIAFSDTSQAEKFICEQKELHPASTYEKIEVPLMGYGFEKAKLK